MKIKSYTQTHDSKLIKNNFKKFSSEEHSQISQKENFYHDKDMLLKDNPLTEIKKKLLSVIKDRVSKENYRNILSIGSGNCVDEWRLQKILGEGCNVTASEFDNHFINQSKKFFPEIKTIFFNFEDESFADLKDEYDLIYFSVSLYVLDDKEFLTLLKAIKIAGVKEIIDLHGGIHRKIDVFKMIAKGFGKLILRPFSFFKLENKGKFHGYSRSKKDLLKLYKKCGWKVTEASEDFGKHKKLFILN